MTKQFLLAIFLFAYTAVRAQLLLDLDEARKILHSNSFTIKQSELQQKLARVDLYQAYDALIPNLAININNQHTMGLNFDQVTGQLITGNQWTSLANATISSEIVVFQGLKGLYNIKAGKLNVDLAHVDTERLKYELDLQLLSLYFQTLINADLHRASVEQAKLSARQLEQEQIRTEVGTGTLLDLTQARNKLAEDQLNINSAKNAYELSMLKLKQLLDLSADSVVELKTPVELEDTFMVEKYFQADSDPYIRQINKKIEYSYIQNKLVRSSYYPTLTVNTAYGTNYSSRRFVTAFSSQTMPLLDQMNQNRSLYIGLGIAYTIFDRFNTRANVRKSQINIESLQLEKDKVILDRRQVYEQAIIEYKAALEDQKAVNVAYEAAKASYEAMKERYEVGKNSSIDLYKTLTDYNVTEFRRISSKYNIQLKAMVLKLVSGQ